MKKHYLLVLIILILVAFTFFNCSKEERFDVSDFICVKLDTIHFQHSMKGWELYSWSVGTKWKYSFMVGTNAVKTYDQVISNNICVVGEDSLKVVLSKLPAGEEIFWVGQSWIEKCWSSANSSLTLPPRNIQIEIKEFCDSNGLKLYIAD